uniref:Zinc transporter 1 n=1 Tax=Panagrolaimus sp. PS1159 TaxID=55785 RepID=A0AC35GFP1_9BILA
MLLIELFCGFYTKSVTIIADSFHMISDILALIIALISLKISQRPSNAKHTFGWVRAEVLGALVNGVFLLALCLCIFLESLERIIDCQPIEKPWIVLIVGIAGLIVNVLGLFLFHGHSKPSDSSDDRNCDNDNAVVCHTYQSRVFSSTKSSNTTPEKSVNLNMKGVFLHVLSDTLGSCIVIISATICWIFPDIYFLQNYLDPIMSIIMVVIIAISTFPLVLETAMVLLQTTPKFIDTEELKTQLLQVKGVTAVHEFHIWRLVGECIIATVHIHFKNLDDFLQAADMITKYFHQSGIHSVTIQPEFDEGDENNKLECSTACEIPQCETRSGLLCCESEMNLNVFTKPD